MVIRAGAIGELRVGGAGWQFILQVSFFARRVDWTACRRDETYSMPVVGSATAGAVIFAPPPPPDRTWQLACRTHDLAVWGAKTAAPSYSQT